MVVTVTVVEAGRISSGSGEVVSAAEEVAVVVTVTVVEAGRISSGRGGSGVGGGGTIDG